MTGKAVEKKSPVSGPGLTKLTIKKEKPPTRTQVKTNKRKSLFLERFFKTGNISESCRSINISRQAFYDWLKDDPVFTQDFEDAEDALLDFAEGKLMNLIDAKNPTAIIFFLKTKGKERGYIEPTYMNIKGSLDHKHTHRMSLNSLKKSYERINEKDKK